MGGSAAPNPRQGDGATAPWNPWLSVANRRFLPPGDGPTGRLVAVATSAGAQHEFPSEAQAARRLAQLRIRERQAGVLVRTLRGEPVRSEAVFAVDANTGAIVRSRVVVDHEDVRATIEVEFGKVASLGLPVPLEMREDYRRPPSSRADVLFGKYRVDGVATYGDYVRAQVDVEVLGARVPAP